MRTEKEEKILNYFHKDSTRGKTDLLYLLSDEEVDIILESVNPISAFNIIMNGIFSIEERNNVLKQISEIKNSNLLTAYSMVILDKDLYIANQEYYKYALHMILNYDKPDLYIQFGMLLTNDILFNSKNYVTLITELSNLKGDSKLINDIYRIIQDIVGEISIYELQKEYLEPIIELITKILNSVKEVEKVKKLIEQLDLEMKQRIKLLKNNSLKRLELTINEKMESII